MSIPSPFSLAGKRGLVVGIANEQSIAYGCARTASALGASLVLSCINEKAQQVVAPLAAGLNAPLIICNVEQEGALDELVARAAGLLGSFDFVIHSIAWAPAGDLRGRVVDSSPEGFLRAMNVSCHSFAQLAKACEPHMAGGGSLVTMSYLGSEAAVPFYGLMGPVKAALEALVRYMAVELGPRKIRVHAMSPGPIMTRAASGLEDFDGLLRRAIERSPLGRLVTLDEIGNLAAFLVSDAASGMTGQTMYVDGGYNIVN
jgi:enoyl-[acyl-carrier protein] reductase I